MPVSYTHLICVIDGNVGFTGGINLADEYINEKEKHGHWKDTAVLLRGQGVQGLTEMFLELWQFTCQEKLHLCDFLPNESFLAPGFVQPYGDSPLDSCNLAENVYMPVSDTHLKNPRASAGNMVLREQLPMNGYSSPFGFLEIKFQLLWHIWSMVRVASQPSISCALEASA